jgi:hypothetical protein
MSQIEFEIPKGCVLDKEASTDSKLVYRKVHELPESWEEFCKNKKPSKCYYIHGTGSVIVLEPLHDEFTPEFTKGKFFTKDRAESVLALIQLINLKDEYKKANQIGKDLTYYSIIYSCKSHKLIVLKTTNPTLFCFTREDLTETFLSNFKDLLLKALEFVPCLN